MKIHAVIQKALADPIYAAELAAKAGRASEASGRKQIMQGDEWHDLLQEFASTPEELGRLLLSGTLAPEDQTSTTLTSLSTTFTVTTLTTLACSTTSTTTTSTTTSLTTTTHTE